MISMRTKFLAFATMMIALVVITLAQAQAGEYERRRDSNEAAAMVFGFIAGAMIGGAINNDHHYRPRPRYYGDSFYQPRPRRYYQQPQYHGNGYFQPQPRRYYRNDSDGQTRYCPSLGHYQGRIVYRNGCYYPG